MKHATDSCAFNKEVICHYGPLVIKQPDAKELHCSKCGWNPEVERKLKEEARKRYGKKL